MKKKIGKKKWPFYLFASVILVGICMFIVLQAAKSQQKPEEVTYLKFNEYVKAKKVDTIEISLNEKDFKFTLKGSKKKYTTHNPKYEDFKKDMLEEGIEVKEGKDKSNYTSYMFSIISIGVMLGFFTVLQKQVKGEDNTLFKKKNTSSSTFKDIAGLDEVKQDLMTVVEFLKEPQKYRDAGAKLPKGIMLYGPPGTGKTMLAKAIAGEAEVEFFPVAGSEFDERYVGVGAQRIRKLFSDAKKKAPCIIFIDEIDALGGKRKASDSSSDRQSVNQLLSEMDGFSAEDDIIVIAATNRLEDLDPALTRPGRFDSHFSVPLPVNSSDRRKIIDIYTANKKFDDSIDFDLFAKETLGCSPADIEVILNEAAIISVNKNNGIISKDCMDDALFKHIMKGHQKKDLERQQEDIKKAAYHEAGHALLGIICGQEVTKVTIIPSTSGAGGVTFFNNEKIGMYSKLELEKQIMTLYAGRCAEELVYGHAGITTGASNDIERASGIIHDMITKYGMSGVGVINTDILKPDKNIFSEEISDISETLYENTLEILGDNKDILEDIAKNLMEKETMTGNEIKEIINPYHKKRIPD